MLHDLIEGNYQVFVSNLSKNGMSIELLVCTFPANTQTLQIFLLKVSSDK